MAAFFACRTQWRIDGLSGRCWGLDYPGVAVVLNERALKGQPRREVFDGIQVMEAAALEVMNPRKS